MKLKHCDIWQLCDSYTLAPEKNKPNVRFYVVRVLDRCFECGNGKYELITDFKDGQVERRNINKQEFHSVWLDRLNDPAFLIKETKGKIHVSAYTLKTSKAPEQALRYLQKNDPDFNPSLLKIPSKRKNLVTAF